MKARIAGGQYFPYLVDTADRVIRPATTEERDTWQRKAEVEGISTTIETKDPE